MRPWETPVPIPNTMVKPWTADGTWLVTTWESRWLPIYYEYSLDGSSRKVWSSTLYMLIGSAQQNRVRTFEMREH